jgi:hypothetical protein
MLQLRRLRDNDARSIWEGKAPAEPVVFRQKAGLGRRLALPVDDSGLYVNGIRARVAAQNQRATQEMNRIQ